MTLTVKLFARARDLAGATVDVDVADGASVAALRAALAAARPALAGFLSRCAVAVNGEYAADGHAVGPGDEVAVLPPVSGG